MSVSQTALCYAPFLKSTHCSKPQVALKTTLHSCLKVSPVTVFSCAQHCLVIFAEKCLHRAAAGLYDVCMMSASVTIQYHTHELHGMVVQAHAPAQGSLKIRLKLPVGFQQRASRLSSKPVAAPASGKQVKGTLVQAKAEGSMSLVQLLLALLSACRLSSTQVHAECVCVMRPLCMLVCTLPAPAGTHSSVCSSHHKA